MDVGGDSSRWMVVNGAGGGVNGNGSGQHPAGATGVGGGGVGGGGVPGSATDTSGHYGSLAHHHGSLSGATAGVTGDRIPSGHSSSSVGPLHLGDPSQYGVSHHDEVRISKQQSFMSCL